MGAGGEGGEREGAAPSPPLGSLRNPKEQLGTLRNPKELLGFPHEKLCSVFAGALELVDHVLHIHEGVVDGLHLRVRVARGGPEDQAPDAPEAVDAQTDRHGQKRGKNCGAEKGAICGSAFRAEMAECQVFQLRKRRKKQSSSHRPMVVDNWVYVPRVKKRVKIQVAKGKQQ